MKFTIERVINFVSGFKENQPFVFRLMVLSFILATIPFLYCLIAFFYPNKLLYTWIFFIPFVVVFSISLISFFVHRKFPLFVNLIACLLNLFIILVIQCFCGLYVFSFLFCANEEYKFDKPEYYEEVIEHFEKDKVAHFPKHIPEGAKDVEMWGDYLSFFGSEKFLLKFNADKKYIENELKKYKFISIESYKKFENRLDYVIKDGKSFKKEDFTYYIISDRENDKPTRHCFPYHYGLAINHDKTQILYYYSDPD